MSDSKHDWHYFGFRQDLWAWVLGGVVFLLVASSRLLIGHIYSGAEAVQLLEAVEDPALFFASSLAASSTTSLALMLTLLGFTHRLDQNFDDEFFQRVYRIGLYSAMTMGGAVLLILVLIFPLGEFDELPESWFTHLYTVVVGLVAVLSMLILVMVILLFTTIKRLIDIVRSGHQTGSS